MNLYNKKNDFVKSIEEFLEKMKLKQLIIPIIAFSFLFGIIISNRVKSTKVYSESRDFIKKTIYGDFTNIINIPNNTGIEIYNFEGFDIDVKFKDWEKIKYHRFNALKETKIPLQSQEEVPAKIRYRGKTYKVNISLTGGMLSHLLDPLQWSLALKVKGENTILGMKKMALLVPDARGYLTDWIAHKMLKERGLIGLRSNYVDVNINGKYHGVYYIEERFDKRLIENNQLREGIVFKLNLAIPKIEIGEVTDYENAHLNHNTELMPYNSSNINESSEMKSQLVTLKKIWASFETGDLKVNQVLDVKKFASLFAVSDLLNEKHGMSIHNTRFYFNPITSLIEPIAREWMFLNENKEFGTLFIEGEVKEENFYDNYYLRSNIYQKLYNNEEFKKFYIQEAKIISSYGFLEDIVSDNKDEIDRLVLKINKYKPDYEFPLSLLKRHQKLINDKLFPATPTIKVYFDSYSKNNIKLLVENLTNIPNEISMITYNGVLLDSSIYEIQAKQDAKSRIQIISINLKPSHSIDDFSSDSLEVYYNVLGLEHKVENYLGRDVYSKTIVYPSLMNKIDYENLSLPRRHPNLEEFNFLKVDKVNKTISFKQKRIIFFNDLIIPSGYLVLAYPGQNIDLRDSARIISYSSLKFIGKKDNPINIFSSDSTGQGIVVYGAEISSEFEYVHFKHLSHINDFGWNLRGAITFYESPVFIDNCIFEKNLKGDDYLNIVRTKFRIENSKFLNTFADAFDSDFSKGIINNTNFENIGNDAIDVSGTKLEMTNISIIYAGDKGISGGEDSKLNCEDIKLFGCEIGVASKDKTTISINNIIMDSTKLAYCAFQKKPEYGPGIILASKSSFKDVFTEHLIEIGSSLNLNGENITQKSDKVKQYLYGAEYGKDSK